MQRHPEYRQKVEKFRATLSPLQSLFRESIGIDHLEPLIDRIRRADLATSQTPARPAEVRQLPHAARPMRARRHPWHQHYPMAIAASLALLIGAALGSLLQPRAASSVPTAGFIGVSDGRLTAQGPLQDLLEHTARGIPVRAELAGAGSWELEAAFTFRSIGQQPCRRYELRSMAQEHFAGFACRDGDGHWIVQAHAKLNSTPVNPGVGLQPRRRGQAPMPPTWRSKPPFTPPAAVNSIATRKKRPHSLRAGRGKRKARGQQRKTWGRPARRDGFDRRRAFYVGSPNVAAQTLTPAAAPPGVGVGGGALRPSGAGGSATRSSRK